MFRVRVRNCELPSILLENRIFCQFALYFCLPWRFRGKNCQPQFLVKHFIYRCLTTQCFAFAQDDTEEFEHPVCSGSFNTMFWASRSNKRIQLLHNFKHVRRISEVTGFHLFLERLRDTVPRLGNSTRNRTQRIRIATQRDRVPHSILKTV